MPYVIHDNDIRLILSPNDKPMRIPNSAEACSLNIYIRAVWQRIGGLVAGGNQGQVAKTVGISLSTLKRYLYGEVACPYLAQFGLESLAGMAQQGNIFMVEGSHEINTALTPYSATESTTNTVYIVLTYPERQKLKQLAESRGLSISVVVADAYIREHQRILETRIA